MDSTIRVKVINDSEFPELSMKYLNAVEWITPKLSPDGKTVTGLDENSYEISLLSGDAQKKERERVKEMREEFQKQLNIDDLTSSSPFWNNFYVAIGADLALDPTNAMHRLHKEYLIANGAIAPSEESIDSDEKFSKCVYYFYEEAEQRTLKTVKDDHKDKALAEAYLIKGKNPERLKYLFSYLFGYTNDNLGIDTIYSKIREYLEPLTDKKIVDVKRQSKNVEAFLKILELKKEEVFAKVLLDRAVKKGIVRVVKQVHTLKDNDVELGRNFDESLKYLLSSRGSSDLENIKKLVI